MKTIPLFRLGILALFLPFAGHDSLANLAPRRPPRPVIEPTSRARLEVTKRKLGRVLDTLIQIQTENPTPFAGFLEQTIADLMKAQADLGQTFLYLNEHPEENVLQIGPVSAVDSPSAPPSFYPHTGYTLSRQFSNLDRDLYDATDALENGPIDSAPRPILGPIGGFRTRIIEDITRARSNLSQCKTLAAGTGLKAVQVPPRDLASNDNPSTVNGPRNVANLPSKPASPSAQPTVEFTPAPDGVTTVIQIPRSLLQGALTSPASREQNGSRAAVVIASLAGSLAVTLLGLYLSSRRKRSATPGTAAAAVATTTALALVLVFATRDSLANMPPRHPPRAVIEPTSRAHLDASKRNLETALEILLEIQKRETSPLAGFLEQTIADLRKAQANLEAAYLYLKAHPEENSLPTSPVTNTEPRPALPYEIPYDEKFIIRDSLLIVFAVLDRNLFDAVDALKSGAVDPGARFSSDPVNRKFGPLLSPLGGVRLRLIADIERARSNLAQCRMEAVRAGWKSVQMPERLLARALTPLASREQNGSRAAVVIATIAASLAVMLLGLFLLSRRKRSTAAAAATALAICAATALANMAPMSPLQLARAVATSGPITSPLRIEVLETGTVVRIAMPSSTAHRLAAKGKAYDEIRAIAPQTTNNQKNIILVVAPTSEVTVPSSSGLVGGLVKIDVLGGGDSVHVAMPVDLAQRVAAMVSPSTTNLKW